MTNESQFQNNIFRYRSIEALLGKNKELELQTIYFAPSETLNDPMEGFRQLYWHGDRITWRNLLRHYIICLHKRLFEAQLAEDSMHLSPETISVFASLDNFKTKEERSLCKLSIAEIEATELHTALLDFLTRADRDIKLSELKLLLSLVHLDWYKKIYTNFSANNLIPQAQKVQANTSGNVATIKFLQEGINRLQELQEKHGEKSIHFLYNYLLNFYNQNVLLAAVNNADKDKPKSESLFFDFTSEYLNSLLKIVYPPWSVACFSARHDNASMWSHYANNHSGCCLVFQKTQSKSGEKLRLNGPSIYGSNEVIRSDKDQHLNSVEYEPYNQCLEFFGNIGQLPFNDILKNWFQDDDGNISPLADYLKKNNISKWRNTYQENFASPLLKKLPDWKHEEERRIIIQNILGSHSSVENQTYTYDYNTLDGIIFGLKTSLSDKVKIMRIIDQKLSKRSVSEPFKFYQAHYNIDTGRIEAVYLNAIDHKGK